MVVEERFYVGRVCGNAIVVCIDCFNEVAIELLVQKVGGWVIDRN